MIASTNDSYCPTLRSISDKGVLPDNVAAVYEVVVDGLSEDVVKLAMCRGIHGGIERDPDHYRRKLRWRVREIQVPFA